MIELLRGRDRRAAARALQSVASARAWAAWSVACLAARYGQVPDAPHWAREELSSSVRVAALLGMVAYLGEPPPYEGGFVFGDPPGGAKT